MLKQTWEKFKKEKGFTLVELLAVIAILGIIVAIAVPVIGNVIDNSENNAKVANIELIENAAKLADISNEFTEGMSVSDLATAGYLNEVPTIPGTTKLYSGKVSKADNGIFTYIVGDAAEEPK